MNIRVRLVERWRRDLVRIVVDALAKRSEADLSDPDEDEETFEEMLLALYPPDGCDGRRNLPQG